MQFHTDYITSCAWAPNSRYLILGTCYPRMKVDNRLYVYKFNGNPIRPPTVDDMTEMRTTVVKKAPSKYVPPHLRAKQNASGAAGTAGAAKKKNEPK